MKQTEEHHIDLDQITVSERINQLADILRSRRALDFEELFDADRTRADVIITFLALLEMTRLRLTRISQAQPYESIRIELAVSEEDDSE